MQKILDLVVDGITAVQEVKKALRHYVLHVLIPEVKTTPDVVKRTYFSATTNIQNHVYTAQRSLKLSKFVLI